MSCCTEHCGDERCDVCSVPRRFAEQIRAQRAYQALRADKRKGHRDHALNGGQRGGKAAALTTGKRST